MYDTLCMSRLRSFRNSYDVSTVVCPRAKVRRTPYSVPSRTVLRKAYSVLFMVLSGTVRSVPWYHALPRPWGAVEEKSKVFASED